MPTSIHSETIHIGEEECFDSEEKKILSDEEKDIIALVRASERGEAPSS